MKAGRGWPEGVGRGDGAEGGARVHPSPAHSSGTVEVTATHGGVLWLRRGNQAALPSA